jgi:Na+-transporting methylmalonyl-CoA/oxaloacetate decarboxylase gamma subunit
MWKVLAVKYWSMLLLLVLVVAILGMSRYAETRKNHHRENASHVNGIMVAPDKAAESAKETDKLEDSPSWIDTFTWPNGVTA